MGEAALAGHRRPVSDRCRILLCDADSQSLHALRVVLHGAGFEVDATRTAEEALDRGALRLPTAAIVEVVLPDGDGVEVCRRLREWSAMPIILLSAVCDEEAQVRAFEAGADDYVTKPFRPRELVARLLANLRRADPGGDEPCVELDGLEIDLAARVVRRDGDEVHLTPIEFKLLGGLDTESRTATDPQRAVTAGLGRGVHGRPTDAARAHREPATQDRAARRRAPHTHRSPRRLPLGGRASGAGRLAAGSAPPRLGYSLRPRGMTQPAGVSHEYISPARGGRPRGSPNERQGLTWLASST